MSNSALSWFCSECMKKELPFNSINAEDLKEIYKGTYISSFQTNTTQSINNTANFLSREYTNNMLNCSYYNLQELNKINIKNNKYFSLLHLNISSLSFHHEDLENLLEDMNIKPEIIGITESRVIAGQTPLSNISLENYNIEQTETESTKGGSLLYIADRLNYKTRRDLHIYKTKELESVFNEITNDKGISTIHRLHI